MIQFSDLLHSKDEDIRELAEKAKDLKLKLLHDEINQSEFDELFEDLKGLKYIEDNMWNLTKIKKLKDIMDLVDFVRHWAP